MKIKFENNLKYQEEAIKSITDIFKGQETCNTMFSIIKKQGMQYTNGVEAFSNGIGNKISLLPEEILENLNNIQERNGLSKTKKISPADYNFTVEMETGTGKTYVYLRTILELNKLYGFLKFIIVVPSIAIKEGVFKTLEITKDHFSELYNNVIYDYFIYDSKRVSEIINFAQSTNIEIMIINRDSFNKESNILNKPSDSSEAIGYERPMEFIKETNPIVIVDEPQNMESEKSKMALSNLNPVCTLRYSATHKKKYNYVYKLNSIDAYEKQLVKQIEVATVGVTETNNTDYIKLLSVNLNKKTGIISAKLEMDIKSGKKVSRKEIKVVKGEDLSQKAKRSIYDGYEVIDISVKPGDEWIDLGKVKLKLDQVNGGLEPDLIKRLQIRRTVEEHLEKQLRLKSKGIKVLSLFFVDKVANYRIYDEDGNALKGKYAKIFEEEYRNLLETGKYNDILDGTLSIKERAEIVHDGYFSKDKKRNKKTGKDYYEEKDTKGNTVSDNETFNKIMKEKEKLLSFKEPLSFIFSHSALKEGWDNPNVFQICTLVETKSEMSKRQKIGRGLRIAVNQNGERVKGFAVNTLTVMANESYEEFADGLQNEIKNEENVNFGIIEEFIFSNIVVDIKNEKEIYLGHEKSKELYNHLIDNDYINKKGVPEEKLKTALKTDTFEVPKEFENIKKVIEKKIKSSIGKLTIKDADKKVKVKINKEVFLSEKFKELWDKVKYRTTYFVDFNEEELIKKCVEGLDEEIYISKVKETYSKAKLKVEKSGVNAVEISGVEEELKHIDYNYRLPDILSYLQNETNLTRKAIVKILITSKTLNTFKKNPQLYLEQATDIIKRIMKSFVVDGIKYEKLGESEYYCQELFEDKELIGYLKTEANENGNLIESKKSPYNYVVYDSSTIENPFVVDMEKSENVKFYAKLPSWFKIDTPLGSYNPDWVVLLNEELEEKLYFVIETKGTNYMSELRLDEQNKIKCARRHFEALETGIEYKAPIKNLGSFFDKL